MTEKYIIAIDQSTTGTKALLIARDGTIRDKRYMEHWQIHPRAGWVEHDPEELLANVRALIRELMSENALGGERIQAVAVTNQRETTLAWDKLSGKPVYNAIVWQCSRAGEICRRVRQSGAEDELTEKTGLPLSEYFSGPKLGWIMENVPEAARLRDSGRLLCGTIDSWLVWNLSVERSHVTDHTNASRMALFNLNELCWDERLLELFGLRAEMMPKVIYSDEIAGHMELDGCSVPISGLIGDSHGALFAQNGLEQGLKVTYGTGSSLMVSTGAEKRRCRGLATTIAYAFGGSVCFAVEGNINCTGATVKWVTDKLGLIDSARDAEAAAVQLEDNGGVYLVPAFAGLGAPYWAPGAKALIYGMSYDTDARHIVRAALESIAYQVADVVEALEEGGVDIAALRVDGKPTENGFLMQFQADISGKTIVKNAVEEASAFGSALMAGLATGFWQQADIPALIRHGDSLHPRMDRGERERLRREWKRAVDLSIFKN